MPLMMDDPLEQDGFDPAAAAAALGSQALDHEIDMGDLFGDDAALSIPPQPPARGLAARITELSECGACQRVAWSSYGPIATLSADSRSLRGSALTFDQQSGRWQLSKGVPVKLPDGYDGVLQHVSWSFIGHDLAVLDTSGRALLYSAQLGHSHFELRGSLAGPEDVGEMGCVVGLHWLPPYPQPQKFKTFWSAQQEADTWQWQTGVHATTGPTNPIDSKAALLAIDRGGRLRLLHQIHDSTWREASTSTGIRSLDHQTYLTHASFAPDTADGLFMATYDTEATLRLYKVNIDWAAAQVPTQEGQQPSFKTVNPTMKVAPIKIISHYRPPLSSMSDQGDLSAFGASDTAQYVLTHLNLVPPPLEQRGDDQQRLQPAVISIFKNVASILPSLAGVPVPSTIGVPDLIWTWELQQTQQSHLSNAFNQLASKKKAVDAVKAGHYLDIKHIISTPLHNTAVAITATRYNAIIAISMADGSVEFRKRDTMDILQGEYNFSSVYSLPQSGFCFAASEPVLDMALSPNDCCALSLSVDSDEASLRVMENQTVDLNNPETPQQRSATAAVLALQLCGGMLQIKGCQDDVYAAVHDGDKTLQYEIIELAYSALGTTLAFIGDDAKETSQLLFRLPWHQKLISQQTMLGQGKQGHRSLSSKLAFVTLGVRQAAFILTMVFRNDLALKADVALSLGNLVQWCLDLMIYVLQEIDRLSEHLIHLSNSDESIQKGEGSSMSPYENSDAIEAFLLSENSPALFLLLCSSPRMLLRMLCRPLRHGWIHCINFEKASTSPQARAMFMQALSKYMNSPICKQIPPPAGNTSVNGQAATGLVPGILFELLIQQADAVVMATYTASGKSAAERARIEKDMFIHAKIPTVLMPAVKRLLTDTWPKFVSSSNVNFGAIYKHDISWLGFTEDRYTKQWQRKHVVDVVKKTIMARGGTDLRKIRYCTRCASGMEDIQPEPRWPGWVIGSMKNCICLGNWGKVEG